MNRRLLYLVGPSGAGKDSLLQWLLQNPPPQTSLRLARRTVTRRPEAAGEQHESVDVARFESLRQARAFALHWQANGLHYGVRQAEFEPMAQGAWVMVSGSRAHLPQAQVQFPGLTAVYVTATVQTLHSRLLARGRESGAAVQARLQRAIELPAPPGSTVILNEGPLSTAGQRLLALMGLDQERR
jgi:ribose 1,5-bisphosphokinase